MIKHYFIAAIAALALASSVHAEPITPTPAEQAQLDALNQTDDWFTSHLKGPRETSGDAVLDARLQYVLENVTRPASAPAVQAYLRNSYKTPEGRAATRTALDRYWDLHTLATPDLMTEDSAIVGRDGAQIPVRIYRPARDKPLPILVYYHGGGFMFGSIDGWDRTARLIANEAHMIVVSVGYRLAPENPYPAAWNDAEDAYLWTVDQVKTLGGSTVSVGGDSAGGTLAIAVALRARDGHKPMPAAMLLYYPGVDRVNDYPSMKAFGTGYGLDADNLKYLADQVYPANVATTSADTSPIQADLGGLPVAYIVIAGFDPLRDSQAAFSKTLFASGNLPGGVMEAHSSLIHGFLQTTAYVPEALDAARTSARDFGKFAADMAEVK